MAETKKGWKSSSRAAADSRHSATRPGETVSNPCQNPAGASSNFVPANHSPLRTMRKLAYAAVVSGACSHTASMAARCSGCHRSSLSQKATNSPLASASPRLSATICPELAMAISRTGGPKDRMTSPVASVEPSLTTSTSSGARVWPRMEAIVSPIRSARLKAGMTALTDAIAPASLTLPAGTASPRPARRSRARAPRGLPGCAASRPRARATGCRRAAPSPRPPRR